MRKDGMGVVFWVSTAIVGFVVLVGVVSPSWLGEQAASAQADVSMKFGWLYLFATVVFLGFALYAAFGPYGRIKLGRPEDEPDYPLATWLAMLFSAGMGIGLVFWGVAEPMYHFAQPPSDAIDPESKEAARTALKYSLFHWGLHPWAIYCVIAMAIAYTNFRRGDSGLISACFRPLLGDRVDGPIGKAIDTLAVVATVAGVATSLGLGALQINGGLSHLSEGQSWEIPLNTTSLLLIILVVTVLYMTSATTGLDKGIKWLSNTNMVLASLLFLFLLLLGPTNFIIDAFTTMVGDYAGSVIPMSFELTPFTVAGGEDGGGWVRTWTVFYWAWWIAWAPFVGSFIARVSRGRTIREFVLWVLIVPTLICGLWFAAFGGGALHLTMFGDANIAAAVVGDEALGIEGDVSTALFVTLSEFPLGILMVVVATLLITTFFITSADSATFVLGMLSSNGALNPSTATRLTWGALQSSIAAVLLVAGIMQTGRAESALEALQSLSILAALPFTIVMLLMVVSLNKALRMEMVVVRAKERRRMRKLEALLDDGEEAEAEALLAMPRSHRGQASQGVIEKSTRIPGMGLPKQIDSDPGRSGKSGGKESDGQ